MRCFTFLLALFFVLTSLSANAQRRKKKDKSTPVAVADTTPAPQAAALPNAPVLKFDTLAHNFGTATEGQVVRYTFRFRNAGSQPLQLTNVRPSCGCTASEWPKDPIKPGATGEIIVGFNTAGKLGPQTKLIEVFANTEPPHVTLSLKGEVISDVVPVEEGDN